MRDGCDSTEDLVLTMFELPLTRKFALIPVLRFADLDISMITLIVADYLKLITS